MKVWQKKSGITLIEVLVAMGIFSIAAVISTAILVSVVQAEKRSTIENALYDDIRIITQLLTNEIQSGAIDYEEYYSYYVVQNESDYAAFGINHGLYGSRFFDPGESLVSGGTDNPENLGMECSYPADMQNPEDCEIVYSLSIDLNTGQNPFNSGLDLANAFCDATVGAACADDTSRTSGHLFLIDSTGTKKTIIGRKSTNGGGGAIGMVRMEGADTDQNGIVDSFECTSDFNCGFNVNENSTFDPSDCTGGCDWAEAYDGLKVPTNADLANEFDLATPDDSEFIPFTPLRSSILDLTFKISPVEDPYKAYAEPLMQKHPSVTIFMIVDLADEIKADYPGTFNPLTIQTTVAAGVIGRIDTYPPFEDIIGQNLFEPEDNWANSILNP